MKARLKTTASLTMATALLGAVTAMTVADHHGETATDKAPKVAKVGEKAPDFTLTDTNGNEHRLSDYHGKTIVLEWFNAECPFVVHLYRNGSFKTQGNELHAKEDYVWLAVNSNPPGTQGGGLELNRHYVTEYGIEYPVLLDEDSRVGRLYDARVTPHMYIIDSEGILRYNGAIDNAPRGNVRGGGELVNYVKVALEQLRNGETVSPSETRPYGCTVKYQDEAPEIGNRPGRGDRSESGDRRERRERGNRGRE